MKLSYLLLYWSACVVKLEAVKIRLVGGKVVQEGRVEIWYNGTWGTVCDDRWGPSEAHVVCRQLGYVGAVHASCCAHFGWGYGRIWLDDVDCSAEDESLEHCAHAGWGETDCTHIEDAGVVCTSERIPTIGLERLIVPSRVPFSEIGVSTNSRGNLGSKILTTPTQTANPAMVSRVVFVEPTLPGKITGEGAKGTCVPWWVVLLVNIVTMLLCILGFFIVHRCRITTIDLDDKDEVELQTYNENALLSDNQSNGHASKVGRYFNAVELEK